MKINPALAGFAVPLDTLKPDPENSRIHDDRNISLIMESLTRYGQQTPLVVRGGIILKGNATYEAAKRLGWKEIAAIPYHLKNGVRGYKLVDNRSAELAAWGPILAGELQKLVEDGESLEKLGWTEDEFRTITGGDPIIEDEVPEVPKIPKTKKGDIYTMGQHRLLCGDSTNADDVARVSQDLVINMIFTDPPWNVAIGKDSNPRHRQRAGLVNDDLGDGFAAFLKGWTAACLPRLVGDIYCVMGSREWPAIDQALRDDGLHWSAVIVWVKDSFVLGRRNYHPRFEPIWYGWPEKGKSSFNGARNLDDVWEIARPKISDEHPTMKPVELVARAIGNSSKHGSCVFDPFAGAGSTLMAAEQTGRQFIGIEIDPGYCDVIITRWENFTGKKARLNRA